VNVRQMAFKIDDNRTEGQAMAIASGVQVRMGLGETFDVLAAEQSDWNAADDSGAAPETVDDLAAIGVGADFNVAQAISERSRAFDPAYIEAAMALEEGQISEPFVASYGFGPNRFEAVFILEATKVTPESYAPLDEVRESLRQRMANQRAAEKLNELQDAWDAVFYDYTTIDGFAEWAGLTASEPEWIDFMEDRVGRLSGVPGDLSASRGLLDQLRFEGGVGVLRLGGSVVALEVTDTARGYVPRTIADDERTSPTLVRTVRNVLASKRSEAQAAEFLAAVNDNPTSFTEIAEEMGRFPASAGPATREAIQDPNLARIDAFTEKTVAMRVGDVRSDELNAMANGRPTSYVVWRLTAKTEPDTADFREQVPMLESSYLSRKQQGILEEHYADLLRQGKVTVKPNESLVR
jgi:hypothetical protein